MVYDTGSDSCVVVLCSSHVNAPLVFTRKPLFVSLAPVAAIFIIFFIVSIFAFATLALVTQLSSRVWRPHFVGIGPRVGNRRVLHLLHLLCSSLVLCGCLGAEAIRSIVIHQQRVSTENEWLRINRVAERMSAYLVRARVYSMNKSSHHDWLIHHLAAALFMLRLQKLKINLIKLPANFDLVVDGAPWPPR